MASATEIRVTSGDAFALGDQRLAIGLEQLSKAAEAEAAAESFEAVNAARDMAEAGNGIVDMAMAHYLDAMNFGHPTTLPVDPKKPVLADPFARQGAERLSKIAFNRAEQAYGSMRSMALMKRTPKAKDTNDAFLDLKVAARADLGLRHTEDGSVSPDPVTHSNAAYTNERLINVITLGQLSARELTWKAPTAADGVPEVHSARLDAIEAMREASIDLDEQLAKNPPTDAAQREQLKGFAKHYREFWTTEMIDASRQVALGMILAVDVRAMRSGAVVMDEATRAALESPNFHPTAEIADGIAGYSSPTPYPFETPNQIAARIDRSAGTRKAFEDFALAKGRTRADWNAMVMRYFDGQVRVASHSSGFNADHAVEARAALETALLGTEPPTAQAGP